VNLVEYFIVCGFGATNIQLTRAGGCPALSCTSEGLRGLTDTIQLNLFPSARYTPELSTIKPIGGLIRERAMLRDLHVCTEHVIERARLNRKQN
jgi:hypothetical protein